MSIKENSIVGQIVAEDYRTASVFKSYNIDFCCKGNRSIYDVSEKANVNTYKLIEELNQATSQTKGQEIDFKSWDIDLLADYIEKTHHRYIRKRTPEIKAYLNKIAKVHGARHPELIEIEQLFTASAHELFAHMEKEEKVLFPWIRNVVSQSEPTRPGFGTVENPIKMMMHEHDKEGERFRRISELSQDYNPPKDACTTYKVAFSMLEEFENDLHLHIHLENNILFPNAIAREEKLVYA